MQSVLLVKCPPTMKRLAISLIKLEHFALTEKKCVNQHPKNSSWLLCVIHIIKAAPFPVTQSSLQYT